MALSGGERGRKGDPAIERLSESNARRMKGDLRPTVREWGSSYSDLGRKPREIEPSPHTETAAAELSGLVGEMTPAAPGTQKITFDALFNSVIEEATGNPHTFNALHDPGSKEHRQELHRRYQGQPAGQPAEHSSTQQKQKPDVEDEEFDYEAWEAEETARFGEDGLEEFVDVNEDTADAGPMPWESWNNNQTEEDTNV